MALDLGTLVAFLQLDTKKFDQGLEGSKGKAKRFGSDMSSTFAAVGRGLAAVGLAAFAKSAIDAASDLAESQSKVSVIFGDSAKAILDYSETGATAIGQTKQQVLDGASTFATFGKGAGLAGDDLSKFAIDLTGLSSDLASFFNTDPQQAIEAIGAALRGESEPIRNYGVLLDEASIKAQAIEMGLLKAKVSVEDVAKANLNVRIAQKAYNEELGKSGSRSLETAKKAQALKEAQDKLKKATQGTVGDLDKQTKVLAIQGAIFAQTKDAQGDFARTSDGLANSSRTVKAEFENLKTELGTALMPIAKEFVGALKDMAEWGDKNKDWLVPIVATFGAVAAAVYTVSSAMKAAAAAQWLLNVAMGANPVGAVILAIAALVAGFIWLQTKMNELGISWGMVWDGIKETFKMVINTIIDAWNGLDFGIHVHAPDWMGGFGFDIDDVIPDIPRLARGGMIPPRPGGTPVIMGEAGQVEIASPEPMLRRIVREETGGGGDKTLTVIFEGRGVMRGVRKKARIGGGRPEVVLVGG